MKTWFTCIVLYNGFQENARGFTTNKNNAIVNAIAERFLIKLK